MTENDTKACRKISFSSAAGNCIEIGDLAENGRVVRDSDDPTGPVLTVPLAQLRQPHFVTFAAFPLVKAVYLLKS